MTGGGAPATVWAVSDGRAGIESQVLGLAEAVARRRPCEVVVKRIGWKGWAGALPARLNPAPRSWLSASSAIDPPWPDLWIAAGRASLPLSIRVKRWSGGRAFVVQIQDPRLPPSLFDLVIPPTHDRIEGANVAPILGSPNRVTAEVLKAACAHWDAALAALPRPRVAVLIGGRSKAHDLGRVRAEVMAREIAGAVEAQGGSVLATFSRRTPAAAQAVLAERLGRLPGLVWNGTGENPYFAFLAAADYILVTEDSTNMATEAAATGKPVLVMRMDGRSRKLARFHADLTKAGVSRPFSGVLQTWTYAPLDETARAADMVLTRWDAARQ